MKLARLLAALALIALIAALLQAFKSGLLLDDENTLPWLIISAINYSGVMLISGWILYRERSFASVVGWIVFVLLFDLPGGLLYAYIALQQSGGDRQRFWKGYRALVTQKSEVIERAHEI